MTATTSSSAAVGNAGTNLGLAAEQVSASDQLKFSPESITAHVGDIVKWTNTGSIPHTVTFDRYPSLSESMLNGGASWEVTSTV
ncbi:MAG TPA: plastocyanin/azurin family copper-binding protein [Candidatus Sulfotelmatobacter sp.]|nr:plastocyanin/azurin family copper-binding protein [Candidatus Sulfotelmatobacter sp.]